MSSAPPSQECSVVELRQYTLHPGRRDALVDLFDREFLETQEDAGMRVIGQFRDTNAPDRFVWLRGYAGMAERLQGLQAFYGGATWAAHRDAANATMVDSDDVLLLRPAWEGSGVGVQRVRPPAGTRGEGQGLVDITVFTLRQAPTSRLLDAAQHAGRVLREGGALDAAWYVTEPSPNNFPRLPIREGLQVLVGVALFPGRQQFEAFVASGRWQAEAAALLQPHLAGGPRTMRLAPTARSALRA